MKIIYSFDNYPIDYIYKKSRKETLIFLHPLGFDYTYWLKSVFFFKKKEYSVLSYTLRGHSQRRVNLRKISLDEHIKDLDFIISKLKIKDPILIGASLGGYVALAYAGKYAGRIKKCICINAPLLPFNQSVLMNLRILSILSPLFFFDFLPRGNNTDFSKSKNTNSLVMFIKGLLKNNSFGIYLNIKALRENFRISKRKLTTIWSRHDDILALHYKPDYLVEGSHHSPISQNNTINELVDKIIRNH